MRRHPRYEIDLGSFAVFRGDSSVLPGLIVDISKGGLAFFYHADENWPKDSTEIYCLFGERCNVEDVSLVTTYDAEVLDVNHQIYQILAKQKSGPTKIRRRGVTFGVLSAEQEEGLEALICEYRDAQQ